MTHGGGIRRGGKHDPNVPRVITHALGNAQQQVFDLFLVVSL